MRNLLAFFVLLLSTNISMAKSPAVSIITGYYFYLCSGATAPFFNGSPGGAWTINPADAGVASVSATGVVSGIGAGTARLSYTIGSASATAVVTVYPTPAAITGPTSVCKWDSVLLSDPTPGGTWSTGIPSLASIGTNGSVYGINHGVATFYYTLSPVGCRATYIVTVLPYAPTIAGPTSVCLGSTMMVNNVSPGGTWAGSDIHAAIDGSGNVTGLAIGTTRITYTAVNGCTAKLTVTINPLPAPISGNLSVCTGMYTYLSDATTPALSWTSSTPSVATVVASGAVGAISTGTTTITFSLTNGCKSTAIVTVNPMPTAGSITGVATVCAGAATALTDAVASGVWSSSAPLVGTVGSTGVLTGVAGGTTTISYTVSNSCASVRATKVVTVSPFTAGAISGTATVATGTAITLSDVAAGGIWSASNSNATISTGGLVTGITPGTVIISYTVTNGCGTVAATSLVTVYTSSVAAITGTTNVCAGATTSLTDVTPGGTWYSTNTAVATVGSTGTVTGMSAGNATISYTVAGVAVTAVINVTGTTAGTIGGPVTVAAGSTITLTDAVAGGVWLAGNSNVTVSPVGVVTGMVPGTVTISYTLTNGCGSFYATRALTVNPSSGTGITGNPSVCIDATTALTDATPGGVWHSSNVLVASVSGTGLVTGSAAGTATISYTVAGVTTTVNVVVNPNPSGIGGPSSGSVCVGASVTMSDFVAGGAWTSTPGFSVTNGTTTTTVTGLSAGAATVTYSLATGCYRVYPLTVKEVPAAISGTLAICAGSTTRLSDVTAGGTNWTSSAPSIATISLSAVVTGIAPGTTTITYTVSSGCVATAVVTVNALPVVGAISGPSLVSHAGSGVLLSDATAGGVWSSTVPSVATVGSGTGLVTAIASAGTTTISYKVTTAAGCAASVTKVMTASAAPRDHGGAANTLTADNAAASASEISTGITASNELQPEVKIVPNPNNGSFSVVGSLGSIADRTVTFEISDMSGKKLYSRSTKVADGSINEQMQAGNGLPAGHYLLSIRCEGVLKVLHFVVE